MNRQQLLASIRANKEELAELSRKQSVYSDELTRLRKVNVPDLGVRVKELRIEVETLGLKIKAEPDNSELAASLAKREQEYTDALDSFDNGKVKVALELSEQASKASRNKAQEISSCYADLAKLELEELKEKFDPGKSKAEVARRMILLQIYSLHKRGGSADPKGIAQMLFDLVFPAGWREVGSIMGDFDAEVETMLKSTKEKAA